jgi:hypothetical protein
MYEYTGEVLERVPLTFEDAEKRASWAYRAKEALRPVW